MLIRLATRDDAPDVARLMAAFRTWYGKATPDDESFRRSVDRLVDDPQTEYLLAGDPAVGVCQLRYRWSVWTDSEDCWLEDLYVSDEARRTGAGRLLVEAAFERARERGCRRIELDVDVDNTPARGLYESLGFGDKGDGGTLFLQRRL
jgi:ribosomal protein S18 acetylase RimI-like enzyme